MGGQCSPFSPCSLFGPYFVAFAMPSWGMAAARHKLETPKTPPQKQKKSSMTNFAKCGC